MKSIYGKLSRMKFEIIPQGYADVTGVTATDNNVDEGIIFVNSSGQEVTGTSTSKAEVIQLSEEISELRSQYEALQNQYDELTVRLQTVQGEYSALIEDYNSLNANYEALEDRTDKQKCTVTLGATNLEKLTEEQKQIAIDKNYTLA